MHCEFKKLIVVNLSRRNMRETKLEIEKLVMK